MVLAVLTSFVAACAAPAPEVVEKQVTVEVTREVPVTVEVEKEVVVEKEITVEITREVPVTVEVTTVVKATPEPVAPTTEVTIPLSKMRTLYFDEADQEYTLYIALPLDYSSSGKTYPVVYLLDGNLEFALVSDIVRILSLAERAMPEVILVGIGYGVDCTGDMDEWSRLRQLDFTPLETGISSGYGGAERYLDFIQGSIIPYVEDNYRADPADRTLVGHSYGGLFTVYTLFHAPETFNRYITLSPALMWDSWVAFEYEEEFAKTHSDLLVKLFLSVGGRESDFVYVLSKFYAQLEGRGYAGLEMTYFEMEGETHNAVLPGAYTRGLRTVFQ